MSTPMNKWIDHIEQMCWIIIGLIVLSEILKIGWLINIELSSLLILWLLDIILISISTPKAHHRKV